MRKDSNQPVHSDGYDRGDHEDTTTKRAMMEESAKPKGTLEKEEDVVVTPKSKRKAFWRRLANAKRQALAKDSFFFRLYTWLVPVLISYRCLKIKSYNISFIS